MDVNILDQEERKKLLGLIYKLACCDGEYADEEKEIISNYKIELDVHEISDTDSINELCDYFATKPEKIRKIVMFEVLGMILADKKFVPEEVEVFNSIKKSFSLNDRDMTEIISHATTLQKEYDQVYDVLF